MSRLIHGFPGLKRVLQVPKRLPFGKGMPTVPKLNHATRIMMEKHHLKYGKPMTPTELKNYLKANSASEELRGGTRRRRQKQRGTRRR